MSRDFISTAVLFTAMVAFPATITVVFAPVVGKAVVTLVVVGTYVALYCIFRERG